MGGRKKITNEESKASISKVMYTNQEGKAKK